MRVKSAKQWMVATRHDANSNALGSVTGIEQFDYSPENCPDSKPAAMTITAYGLAATPSGNDSICEAPLQTAVDGGLTYSRAGSLDSLTGAQRGNE
jgi:hypothetical protein